jgi:hypothetical protein
MEDNNIDLVFEELKRIEQCQSRSDFSKKWLGREDSYFRSIQSKGLKRSLLPQPSWDVLSLPGGVRVHVLAIIQLLS